MADGRTHAKWFGIISLFFIGLLIWLRLYWYIPILVLSNSICDPDEDQKWLKGKTHRNWITHSILWSLIIWGCITLLYGSLDFILLGILFVPLLPHLYLDLLSRNEVGKYRFFKLKHKRVGKYRISFFPFDKHLSGTGTVIWLLVNIIIIMLYILFTVNYYVKS